jgi:hypothetical protein
MCDGINNNGMKIFSEKIRTILLEKEKLFIMILNPKTVQKM